MLDPHADPRTEDTLVYELLATARGVIDEAGVRVIERWFSAPVSPVVLRPTEVETS